ncbi:hypothetical protein TCAL_05402 [Tigriopus californicus]|uniref:Transmembrane protein 209 n=1 Tax=Tigriopus californicus TaxID=6832 RepID=A0A553P2T4_TIGCA|nr:transmembrane protein 209-like [Tigriopus californicus]TRY72008.1 hypothetical protein TCAL_05402 [Tigriopus californicus]|eukprot:TCALIF_05402-PA protein Name:"Similar to TMEM209 Transmembrane protein 209 (Homo sapiens)" AED:0.00 eAED:0.00 QI:110/1/1/1/1/1/2/1677/548
MNRPSWRQFPLEVVLDRRQTVFEAFGSKLSALSHFWALLFLGLELYFRAGLDYSLPPSPPPEPSGRPLNGGLSTWIWRLLLTIWTVLALNFLHLCLKYVWALWGQSDIVLSQAQLDLMHVNAKDPGFGLSPQARKPQHPNPFTPLNGSLISAPPASPPNNYVDPRMAHSPPLGSPILSPNQSLHSSSWIFQRSPASPKFNSSLGLIQDENDLNMYLKEYQTWEKNNGSFTTAQHDHSANDSSLGFRTGGLNGTSQTAQNASFNGYSPLLKSLSYQMSTPMPESEAKRGESKSSGTKSSRKKDNLSDLVGLDPLELVVWMENLRMWISQTVLRRLMRQITTANKELKSIGMTDVLIGETGIEKLRKCSQMHQIVQSVPSLQYLIPYLDLSPHQDYLVQRIKDLSEGGALSEFDWDEGGRFQGKNWSDKLPTDSELIMHCLVCYLDARLPPVKSVIDGKVFSSLYFFKMPDKLESLKIRVPCAIIQTQSKPPHYIIQTESEKIDLNPERNNLFHTLLYFLHYFKTKEHGMLHRVNLGRSGINVLWVVEDV